MDDEHFDEWIPSPPLPRWKAVDQMVLPLLVLPQRLLASLHKAGAQEAATIIGEAIIPPMGSLSPATTTTNGRSSTTQPEQTNADLDPTGVETASLSLSAVSDIAFSLIGWLASVSDLAKGMGGSVGAFFSNTTFVSGISGDPSNAKLQAECTSGTPPARLSPLSPGVPSGTPLSSKGASRMGGGTAGSDPNPTPALSPTRMEDARGMVARGLLDGCRIAEALIRMSARLIFPAVNASVGGAEYSLEERAAAGHAMVTGCRMLVAMAARGSTSEGSAIVPSALGAEAFCAIISGKGIPNAAALAGQESVPMAGNGWGDLMEAIVGSFLPSLAAAFPEQVKTAMEGIANNIPTDAGWWGHGHGGGGPGGGQQEGWTVIMEVGTGSGCSDWSFLAGNGAGLCMVILS